MQPLVLRPTVTELQVRFADTDMLGHINNMSYAAYTEVGRTDFFGRLGEGVPWFVLARLEIDFRREGFLMDKLAVHTAVEHLGETSMTVRQDIVRDGKEVIVSTRGVMVCIDKETHKKQPLPAHWRIPEPDEAPLYTHIVTMPDEDKV